jgi:cytochrome P450
MQSSNEFKTQFISCCTTGGTDTSVTSVKNFFTVLLLFPDIQAKAQAEVDTIVHTGRLPELSDKPKLPYLHAILKELFRWQPIVPTGFPHLTTEDDEYRGYFIPKGSIVMGNTW